MYRPTSKKLKFLKWFVKMFVVSPLEKCTALFKVYAIAGLVVIVWSFYYEISGRLLVEFHYDIEVSRAGIILDTLNTILEMLYNILITITVILFSNRTKENLLREIDELDCIIAKYEPNLRYQENSLLRIMIVVHVFDFSIFVNDIVLILLTQNEYYIAYCYIDQFYRYRIGLFVLYTYCFIKELLQKISIVNETLVKTFENLSPEDLLQQSPEALNQLDAVVQDISRCYAKFCLIVADVNSIFGWLLLSLFINYLCLFLVSFDIALRIKSNVETVGEAQLYFWIAFLMFYALVGAAMVTSICNRTTNEARKTTELSFYYYYKLNISKYYPGQACLAKNLTLLIRQTRSSLTTFSAAGFFPVDYSTLFLLMNLLTSYVIVLIQFE